ncbi:MAG TPA: AraD1 family protein [Steroidobacteraceae bacterium]|nr:AraD1 family protein [Steroidobacteraceae bacterium]
MRLLQFSEAGQVRVARVADDGTVLPLATFQTLYQLARRAIRERRPLDDIAAAEPVDNPLAYADLLRDRRLLPPLTHPDPAHCLVTGTGLTHLGSAAARDAMHAKVDRPDADLTDSMKMFKAGLEGGKPAGKLPGMQPEWFYKGSGANVIGCGQPLRSPDFAEDAGEEPELVGCYVIDDAGRPRRVGFAVGNEFSDHVTERRNYLLLAHSKLRQCGVGPMLNTGTPPAHLAGTSRIRRDGAVLWEKPFLTGEANMCHTFANLEYHHFKYAQHRVPGDVHLHFFGTATVSCADGVQTRAGDQFEIDLPAFGAPLINPLTIEPGGLALHDTGEL